MTPKTQDPHVQTLVSKTQHRPFVIRKAIVLSSIVLAVGAGYLGNSIWFGLGLYFGLVTLFEGLGHYVLHLKSSDFASPEELLKSEWVTSEELDRYFDTRRYIRFVSFAIASYSFAVAFFVSSYALEIFCMAYVVSTFLGILYVRLFVKINRPRLIYRDDRYYFPRHLPRPGYISLEQFALRRVGIYFYGPLDF